MNTKEMFIDSVKYSLKVKWDFLFLGFVFWFLTFSLYIIDEHLIFGIILFIPWLLFAFIEGGYIATVIEETIFGSDIHPKFENFKNLIRKGIKEIFIFVIYGCIPLVILIILIFDLTFFSFNPSVLLLFPLFAFASFFSIIMAQGAIIHYEYNHSKFKTAFEIRKIMRKLKRMGVSRFLASFFIVLLFSLFIIPLISEVSENTHPLFTTIIEFTILPFLAIVSARFMGLIGRYHFKED